MTTKEPRVVDRAWCFLVALYLGGILAANAMAAKLFAIFGVNVTTGALAIPLVYLTTDVINELYGPKATRAVVWMGFAANLVLVLMSRLCIAVPASAYGVSQESFVAVFWVTPRIVAASLIAYLASSMVDVWVFHFLRRLTDGKHFWLRKNGSTVVSQLLDTVVFIMIAFSWKVPWAAMPIMVLGQYMVKIVAAPLGTPLSYVAIKLAKSDQAS